MSTFSGYPTAPSPTSDPMMGERSPLLQVNQQSHIPRPGEYVQQQPMYIPQPVMYVQQEPPAVRVPTVMRDSMDFFRTPLHAWWKAVLGLVAVAVAVFVSMVAVAFVIVVFDMDAARMGVTTPTLFLVNNVGIALWIPIAVAVSYLFYRQGFGWLSSVVGRFRWSSFGVALGVFALGYALYMLIEILIRTPEGYGFYELEILPTTTVMIVGILLTTPIQCAGEEYGLRGIVSRLIAALIPNRLFGLAVAALVSSAVFMVLHSAEDLWLNVNYFTVGLIMWWLTYRTGGLEAAVALHIVNNMFAEWMLPFVDISGMFDRSEGTGSYLILIGLAVQIGLALIVDLIARKRRVVRMSAPGAEDPTVVKAGPLVVNVARHAEAATKKDLPRFDSTQRKVPANPWMAPAWGASAWAAPSWATPPPSTAGMCPQTGPADQYPQHMSTGSPYLAATDLHTPLIPVGQCPPAAAAGQYPAATAGPYPQAAAAGPYTQAVPMENPPQHMPVGQYPQAAQIGQHMPLVQTGMIRSAPTDLHQPMPGEWQYPQTTQAGQCQPLRQDAAPTGMPQPQPPQSRGTDGLLDHTDQRGADAEFGHAQANQAGGQSGV